MKTYSRQPETKSADTVQPKVSRQASAHNVLQTYKDKIVQRQELDEDELLQGKFETAQREEIDEDELLQGKFDASTAQREEILSEGGEANLTGIPDNLKSGIESLSGYSLDDVRVHYNSSKPAQLQALAYAQGTDIHIAPGQEQHLPHEAWHVVQQKQGRVQPTTQLQGVNVNDNEGLEKEADVMGGRAKFVNYSNINNIKDELLGSINSNTIQRNKKNRIEDNSVQLGWSSAAVLRSAGSGYALEELYQIHSIGGAKVIEGGVNSIIDDRTDKTNSVNQYVIQKIITKGVQSCTFVIIINGDNNRFLIMHLDCSDLKLISERISLDQFQNGSLFYTRIRDDEEIQFINDLRAKLNPHQFGEYGIDRGKVETITSFVQHSQIGFDSNSIIGDISLGTSPEWGINIPLDLF
jgi:hypothetical protein